MMHYNTRRRRPRQSAEGHDQLRPVNMKMVCLILMAGLPSFCASFSMVAPPTTTVARPPAPVLTKTALYHPQEPIKEGWKSRLTKKDEERRSRTNNRKKRGAGEYQRTPIRQVKAHESRLFLADPARVSNIWQDAMTEEVALQQQSSLFAATSLSFKPKLRNVAGFVVQQFDNQQLSKGRALLVSPKPSEPNTRTIGDVLFAQESLQQLWRVAGEAVVDFGLVQDQGLQFLDLGQDGAFQVE